MKRRLDRALPAAALALLLALCLGACWPRSAADRVGRALNLTISHARARVSTDSHGGLSRDGTACTVLQALDGSLLEQIRTLDKRRLRQRAGKVDEQLLHQVDAALQVSFGLRQ